MDDSTSNQNAQMEDVEQPLEANTVAIEAHSGLPLNSHGKTSMTVCDVHAVLCTSNENSTDNSRGAMQTTRLKPEYQQEEREKLSENTKAQTRKIPTINEKNSAENSKKRRNKNESPKIAKKFIKPDDIVDLNKNEHLKSETDIMSDVCKSSADYTVQRFAAETLNKNIDENKDDLTAGDMLKASLNEKALKQAQQTCNKVRKKPKITHDIKIVIKRRSQLTIEYLQRCLNDALISMYVKRPKYKDDVREGLRYSMYYNNPLYPLEN